MRAVLPRLCCILVQLNYVQFHFINMGESRFAYLWLCASAWPAGPGPANLKPPASVRKRFSSIRECAAFAASGEKNGKGRHEKGNAPTFVERILGLGRCALPPTLIRNLLASMASSFCFPHHTSVLYDYPMRCH